MQNDNLFGMEGPHFCLHTGPRRQIKFALGTYISVYLVKKILSILKSLKFYCFFNKVVHRNINYSTLSNPCGDLIEPLSSAYPAFIEQIDPLLN